MPRNQGRHELGQNDLIDQAVISRIAILAKDTDGPLVDWGAGDGALTLPLARLGRPVQGIEIDPRRAARLARRVGPHVCITEGDILRHAPPVGSTVVSNIPFHLTTPVLRHLLASTSWDNAILVTQWEVARKRAGVGGTTQLTAQWWPWYEFHLDSRIPAQAFRPRPSVDGGILVITRRTTPLVPAADRRRYQDWTRRVFTGPGRGLAGVLTGAGMPAKVARDFRRRHDQRGRLLPRDLTAVQWAEAYALTADLLPASARRRGQR